VVITVFACDVALVGGALLAIKPHVNKAMKKIPDKSFFSFGTPLDWLNASIRFFTISLFTSLAYLLMTVSNIGVGNMPFGSDHMLIFSIAFLIFGIIFVVRISEFIHSPYSDTNYIAAKITYRAINVGVQISLLAFVVVSQVFNVLLCYTLLQGLLYKLTAFVILYNASVVLSFIAMLPLVWAIIFRLKDKFRRRDLAVMISFILPYLILSFLGILIILGFNPI
jgi:hypothetical protein